MSTGLSIYFILMDFYIFAFVGWVYESTFVTIRDRKPINRGFLVGPMIPLYGFGAVSVYILLRPFSKCASLLYVMGMVVATVLEYLASWLLETLFHAKWWDYSKEPYNFQGRIALIPSMFWGILSLLMFDVFQPAANWAMSLIPERIGKNLLAVFLVITAVDFIYTVITTVNFRRQVESLYGFWKELEYMLEDKAFISLREILLSTKKGISGRFFSAGLGEWKEIFYQKLENLRANSAESESKLAVIEERSRFYWDYRSHFLKKRPFIGNQRILDAFPSMKILLKNRSAIEIKEFLWNRKHKEETVLEEKQGEEE